MKRKKKLDPYKFTFKNKNFTIHEGVYYRNGFAYATTRAALVKTECEYPSEFEDVVIKKDGSVIEGRFPDCEIPLGGMVNSIDAVNFNGKIIREAYGTLKNLSKIIKDVDKCKMPCEVYGYTIISELWNDATPKMIFSRVSLNGTPTNYRTFSIDILKMMDYWASARPNATYKFIETEGGCIYSTDGNDASAYMPMVMLSHSGIFYDCENNDIYIGVEDDCGIIKKICSVAELIDELNTFVAENR